MTEIRILKGAALRDALPDLARLRITVFAEFPYLYDGSEDYERRYLATYETSPGAVVVAAISEGRVVGAATGTPMEDHAVEFAAPLAAAGLAPETCFYCAESVLLPEFRGQGLGHAFFDAREAHARALGRRHAVFCAVVRPEDHPARPRGYRPLDGFWRKRGYAPIEGAFAHYSWTDIGDDGQTEKPMQLWSRTL
ncbi:Acetyltransferase (GNAT) family protein [Pseudoruegeria aquimaris]|uniref:Acetyltransferase (GNAT) family protein n=1 Tax=Pseudoruegeria aquimaris TaxID=393663 RepID=A0A1Y5T1Y1_9RHOB|nr:GNAT family N-acetyltransferase [Pseudoruegeria aquimaris]SLN52180.1 Acetyltransferase (GNAT) family protein [Pseudoruegeria aquimaris]